MEYVITVDSSLSPNPALFADLWNNNSVTSNTAFAEVPKSNSETYSSTRTIILSILGGISLNITSDALYDLIKQQFEKSHPNASSVIVAATSQPDGTTIVTISPGPK